MEKRPGRSTARSLALALAILAPMVARAQALEGRWGGDQAMLTLWQGGARLEAGCDVVTIQGAIHPDASGRFAVVGSRESHQPGPQLADEPVPAALVRLSGQIDGDVLTLRIEPAVGHNSRVHVLRRGVQAKIVRCL